MKRKLTVLLCVVLLISVMPHTFAATETIPPEKIYGFDNFEMYSDGETVMKYSSVGAKKDVNPKNTIEVISQNDNKLLSYVCSQRDPLVDFLVKVSEDEFVFDADYTFVAGKGDAYLFFMISDTAKVTTVRYLGTEGVLADAAGNILADVETGVSYRISVAVNQLKQTYSIYLDGEEIGKDIEFSDKTFTYMKKFRLTAYGGVPISFSMDNWIVYSGNKLFEDKNKYIWDTKFPPDSNVMEFLRNGVAFSPYSDYVIYNGERQYMPGAAALIDNKIYVSGEFSKAAFGSDETELEYNGKNYILAESLCSEILGYNFYQDKNYLCIISQQNFSHPDYLPRCIEDYSSYSRMMLEVNNLLYYNRPKAEQIKSVYSNKTHPRLICDVEKFDALRYQVENDAIKSVWFENFLTKCDNFLTWENPVYEKLDGKRLNVHIYAEPIRCLALAYQLCSDEEKASVYADKAYQMMAAIANYTDWNPSHFLDIGVIMGSISIGYDWIYDWMTANLSSEEIHLIENAVYQKGLIPARLCYLGSENIGQTWTMRTGNWNTVNNSGVVLACAALADVYGDIAFELTGYALRSLEYCMNSFIPDGGWEEGLSYHNYNLRHLSYIIDTLECSYNTDFGCYNSSGVVNSPYFALCIAGATEGFNFHDASGGKYYSSELAWHAAKQDSAQLHTVRYNQIQQGASVQELDLLYLDTSKINCTMDLPLDMYFKNVETGSMRSAWNDTNAAYAGYHCGRNTAWHGQFDSGTFVFDQLGVRWAVDLGAADYDSIGYSDELCTLYRKRAEGQNVYVINPGTAAGQKALSDDYVEKTAWGNGEAFAVINLTDSYSDYVNSARRGIKLTDYRNSLVIRDEIDFKDESEFYWFMHTEAEINIDENSAILSKNGKKMKLEVISNQPLTLSKMQAIQLDSSLRSEDETDDSSVNKIIINGNVSEKLSLEVKLSPVVEDIYLESSENIPLDSWTLKKNSEFVSVIDKYETTDSINSFDFKIMNLKTEAASVSVVAAVYDNDKLSDILWFDSILDTNRLRPIVKSINYDMSGFENPSVKLFLFDSLDSLEPKCIVKKI